ncbi:MAG: hypothetical protein JWN04_4067 [Myxococcaceae bacterium]|nr:hypothetical protein [Myxococcaceae bacterium]
MKNHRNDLAHGVKAFSELGRDIAVEDLRSHVAHAIVHMRSMLGDIELYLDSKAYLAANCG